MRITLEPSLTDTHQQQLMGWRARVFPEEGIGIEWAPAQWHAVAWYNEQPAAHIGFGLFDVTLNGRELSVIGIGGVVVRPEFQGKGYPAQLFAQVHQQAPTLLNCDNFSLFCPRRLLDYYRRHGYRHFDGPVFVPQFGDEPLPRFEFMVRGKFPDKGRLLLQSPPW